MNTKCHMSSCHVLCEKSNQCLLCEKSYQCLGSQKCDSEAGVCVPLTPLEIGVLVGDGNNNDNNNKMITTMSLLLYRFM